MWCWLIVKEKWHMVILNKSGSGNELLLDDVTPFYEKTLAPREHVRMEQISKMYCSSRSIENAICLHTYTIYNTCGICCQKQISQAGICNCIPQYPAGCNYLPMLEISASGNKVVIYGVDEGGGGGGGGGGVSTFGIKWLSRVPHRRCGGVI